MYPYSQQTILKRCISIKMIRRLTSYFNIHLIYNCATRPFIYVTSQHSHLWSVNLWVLFNITVQNTLAKSNGFCDKVFVTRCQIFYSFTQELITTITITLLGSEEFLPLTHANKPGVDKISQNSKNCHKILGPRKMTMKQLPGKEPTNIRSRGTKFCRPGDWR